MSDTPESIEADIARQREALVGSVGALQTKLDVKSHAKARAVTLKDRATTDDGKPRPDLAAGVAAAVVLLGLLVWWRGSRRS